MKLLAPEYLQLLRVSEEEARCFRGLIGEIVSTLRALALSPASHGLTKFSGRTIFGIGTAAIIIVEAICSRSGHIALKITYLRGSLLDDPR